MYVSVLTREYPPTIYGGAGVHVAQLVPQLRTLIDVDVQCMGQPREGATAHAENYPEGANGALRAFSADLSMVMPSLTRSTSSIPTRGMPISLACSPVFSTTSRTSSALTHWSLTVPGRQSSSVAVTDCHPGQKRPPTTPQTPSSQSLKA